MKKISIKTFYLLGIIAGGLIILGVGSSYALFTTSSEISSPITFSSTLNSDSDVIESVSVTVDKGKAMTYTLDISNTSNGSINYSTFYSYSGSDMDFGIDTSKGGLNSSGSLSSGGTGKIYVMIRNNSSTSKSLLIGIVSNRDNVVLGNEMNIFPNERLTNTVSGVITRLYNNSSKKPVVNNSITYQYDKVHSLMKDVGDNIRYYGANPDNYIYFNCDDYSNQSDSTCELWRIIGIVDGKPKIMRNSTIGAYSWDNKNIDTGADSDWGRNDWTDARLMKLLNPGYESEEVGGSLYYNSENGNCYAGQNNATKACDFTTTGLKNEITKELISESTWHLRGSGITFPDLAYDFERTMSHAYSGNSITWEGMIAVPYPSDYGYAADLNKCTIYLSDYDNDACAKNNWLRPILGGLHYGWLLSPAPNFSNTAGFISWEGKFYNSGAIYYGYNIFPTLHIDPELEISSGTGKIDDPYRLKV